MENKEADYAMITIKDPFIQPFERIPKAYKLIMDYINANNIKLKHNDTDIITCFEYEYKKNGTVFMDVYVNIEGAIRAEPYSLI